MTVIQIASASTVFEVTKNNKKEIAIHPSVEPLLYICVKKKRHHRKLRGLIRENAVSETSQTPVKMFRACEPLKSKFFRDQGQTMADFKLFLFSSVDF